MTRQQAIKHEVTSNMKTWMKTLIPFASESLIVLLISSLKMLMCFLRIDVINPAQKFFLWCWKSDKTLSFILTALVWSKYCAVLMRSVFRTTRQGFTSEIALDQYQWFDGLFGSKTGVRRVETKNFVRFERLSCRKVKDGYIYSSTSDWFINFPFCRNDKQIWIANAVILFLTMSVIGNIIIAMWRDFRWRVLLNR